MGQSVEQRFAFDQVATAYAAARPAYPEALIDDVVSYADLRPTDSGAGAREPGVTEAIRNSRKRAILG